ncbi:uracil-DNA glycosylase [Sodalis sp. CWE]|uniref:uracil-DNA glycosylase n=1 Tax=Sodalis sp. CWE TaxID=2803816 RepID=UPI001C7DF094|nr:uracil-DNA glycosylase [Sodalis sp. CWE]MBX4181128.1 uracil-DNA glycosylase [Sodalis sp. CWE]
MNKKITWQDVLAKEKNLPYFQKILLFLFRRRASGIIVYPSAKDIFNAFRFTELNKIKVVILGQDPYHGPNQAHGFSFSVKPGAPIPPSLYNIYRELSKDIPNFIIPNHGCLQSWANQGVMLLNTILTVEAGKAYSHGNIGWEIFTDKVIKILNANRKGIIFLLWGAHAQKKKIFIDSKRHYVLTAPHPSPLSAHRGFFGCRHFSKVNLLLKQQGEKEINWIPIPILTYHDFL